MQPSVQPSRQPSSQPSRQPSVQPSRQPTMQPSSQPSRQPTMQPSSQPSRRPTRYDITFYLPPLRSLLSSTVYHESRAIPLCAILSFHCIHLPRCYSISSPFVPLSLFSLPFSRILLLFAAQSSIISAIKATYRTTNEV